MIVFAGITPHPPLLIPEIGKEETKKLDKTRVAFTKLEQDLYVTKPDVIVVISPHGQTDENSVVINANTVYHVSLKQFGEYTISKKFHGTPRLASKILAGAREKKFNIKIIGKQHIDHGTSIPLLQLTNNLSKISILPIFPQIQNNKQILDFGYVLKNIFMKTEQRVAIIASADLSHALTNDAPAGFLKSGKKFDEKIIELLQSHNSAGIANLDPELIQQAQQCGYNSILMLLGTLKNINYTFKNLCYESPFGVGYLTGEFDFA